MPGNSTLNTLFGAVFLVLAIGGGPAAAGPDSIIIILDEIEVEIAELEDTFGDLGMDEDPQRPEPPPTDESGPSRPTNLGAGEGIMRLFQTRFQRHSATN